mmetsp:Transcript_62140/g.156889  ORF Transcript_62140/g.156889 Transcript_62140/m.156889 type:complete len:242 (-) Transcript_62140:107-832(-)
MEDTRNRSNRQCGRTQPIQPADMEPSAPRLAGHKLCIHGIPSKVAESLLCRRFFLNIVFRTRTPTSPAEVCIGHQLVAALARNFLASSRSYCSIDVVVAFRVQSAHKLPAVDRAAAVGVEHVEKLPNALAGETDLHETHHGSELFHVERIVLVSVKDLEKIRDVPRFVARLHEPFTCPLSQQDAIPVAPDFAECTSNDTQWDRSVQNARDHQSDDDHTSRVGHGVDVAVAQGGHRHGSAPK